MLGKPIIGWYGDTVKSKEVCEPTIVHRRAPGGGVEFVQPVSFKTGTEDPTVEGVEVVRSEGAARNIMQT